MSIVDSDTMADMGNSLSGPSVKTYGLTNSFESGLGNTPTEHDESVSLEEDNVTDQQGPCPKRRKTDMASDATTTSSPTNSDTDANHPSENFKPTDTEEKNQVEDTEAEGTAKVTNQGRPIDSSDSSTRNREERNMASLLQTFIAESKMLHNSWTQLFSNSERFEQYSMERLDKLLQDAKAYELHLKNQKSLLRERLLALSQALHMV